MASIRYRNNLYQVQIRLKNNSLSKSFLTLQSARHWACIEEARILKESNPLYKYKPKSLSEVLIKYQNCILAKKEKNHPDRWIVQAFLRLDWVQNPIDQLSVQDIADYRDQRLKTIKSSSLHRQFFVLRHALNIARREWDWDVPEGLFKRVRIPLKPLKAIRRITDEQQEKLLCTCLKMGRKDMHFIVLISLRTALRRSEILSLEWKDIDCEKRLITVHQTKNGHHRTLPIAIDLYLLLLKTARAEEGRLFTLSPNAVRLAFDRIRRRAGLKVIRFHDLRHEAISSFFEMGLTVPEVAMISGHRTLSVLMRYSHGQLDRICSKIN